MDAPPARNPGAICKVEGCDSKARTRGMCNKHALRDKQGRDLSAPTPAAEWHEDEKGYVVKGGRDHTGKYTTLRQHRLVMAEVIGRPLFNHETPHHKNGVRNDNRPENLELWSTSQPSGQRVEDKMKWAIEFLEQYGATVIGARVSADGGVIK